MFHQSFRSLDDHLGYTFVAIRKLIKGGIDNFHIRSCNGLPDIGNLLRPLINQKDNQVHLRMVRRNRPGNLL